MPGAARPLLDRQDLTLLAGTLLFSRLLIFITWDQLSLVSARDTLHSSLSGLLPALELPPAPLLPPADQLLPLAMEELIGRNLVCGNGTGTTAVGRVRIDFACLEVAGPARGYQVLGRSHECYTCGLAKLWAGQGDGAASFQVETRYPSLLAVEPADGQGNCSTWFHFEQFGLYSLDLDTCAVSVKEKPVNAFLPIFWAFILLCLLAGLRLACQSVYRTTVFRRLVVWLRLHALHRTEPEATGDSALLLEEAPQEARKSRRVVSLDAFRGLAITVMIFVNYGGGSYYFFNHSIWNGLTVADLVFPWFLWIMGVSLVISTQSQLRNSVPRRRLAGRVLRRSLVLIMLGLVMNTDNHHNDLAQLRIPGVLQRFGLSYLLVGLVECWRLPRQYPSPPAGPLADLASAPVQWALALACLALHPALSLLLPVPGCPTGYLGPGGKAEDAKYWNCTGGAARWIDVSVFGEQHIYQSPTSQKVYGGPAHDPEGLLGLLTSAGLVWLGAAAGRVLLAYTHWQARAGRWLLWAGLTGLAAAALCGFSLNGGPIPINKNLWSLSFVLATGAMAFLLLTIMYLLIDVCQFWSGVPLYYPGMNSILLYLGHELSSGMMPWSWRPLTHSHAELLAMNLWGAALWVLTSYLLYRKRVFFAL